MRKLILLLIFTQFSHSFAREINAYKINDKIVIDGKVSSSEWPKSIFQSDFTQMEPNKGHPSAEKTEVAVQFDDKNIYVAFICFKTYKEPVIAEQTRRDQLEKRDDVVVVVLDTYSDSRSAFWFMSNVLIPDSV